MNHPNNEADASPTSDQQVDIKITAKPSDAASAEATQGDQNPFAETTEQSSSGADAVDATSADASGSQTDPGNLQAELEKTQAKAEENWNLYLSTRAEMENLRKRGERDVQNAHKFALKEFVDALLPIKDSLEMGIAAANDTADIQKLLEGSELTLKMLVNALAKFGVQEVNPQGEPFNPEFHEAMAMQPAPDAIPNTVLQVIQKGYLLNERLIRPAMVIVAQAPRG